MLPSLLHHIIHILKIQARGFNSPFNDFEKSRQYDDGRRLQRWQTQDSMPHRKIQVSLTRFKVSLLTMIDFEQVLESPCANYSPSAIDATGAEQIDRICTDEIASEIRPDDEIYYIVKLLEEVCVRMDERSMQRVLREIDITNLEYAMKILGGKARRKMFDNMSEWLTTLTCWSKEWPPFSCINRNYRRTRK